MSTDVEISRPGKVLYPGTGYTKADVVDHYEQLADVMLPHLRDRALVLHRFPDGLDAPGFFQKEASQHFPDWIGTVTAPANNERGEVRHVVAEGTATLRYLADQACLELHRWLSHTGDLDKPDLLVIDLDPPDGADLGALRATARATRDLLDRLGLVPFLQATGGSGYHVVAPLDDGTGFDDTRELAHRIAERLAADDPDRRTTEQLTANRGDRIFLDVNRNAYAQTAIAPYSLRARPGATVATPLDWSELGKVEPHGFGLRGTSERALRDHLAGQRFGEPWRYGKWLGLPVSGGHATVLLHFGMTGSLEWNATGHRHDRVVFSLDGGELRYRDMRKLTGLRLATDGEQVDAVLAERLGSRRRGLKGALMDQGVVAGLGNLLVDETLWWARLHPRRGTAGLSRAELSRLHGRMGTVLRQGAKAERVPDRPSWLTGWRDTPDGPCPRCGTPVTHGRVDGRSTVWCPYCQPG